MGLAQAIELLPEEGVLGARAIGVLIGDALGNATHVAKELAIAGDVGNLQVEGDATLLRTLEVARATQLEVSLGNLEAIVGAHHDLEAFLAFFGELHRGYEDAV